MMTLPKGLTSKEFRKELCKHAEEQGYFIDSTYSKFKVTPEPKYISILRRLKAFFKPITR